MADLLEAIEKGLKNVAKFLEIEEVTPTDNKKEKKKGEREVEKAWG